MENDQKWGVTWRDTAIEGLPEHMVGTKFLRYMANIVGANNPDREWAATKDLYRRAAVHYGRADHRAVERSCRVAIKAAGLTVTTMEMVYALAEYAWERRAALGVPDEEEWF